jgi:hypothetical protein
MRLRSHDPSWVLTLLAVSGALAVTVILTGTRLLVPSEQAVIPSSVWAWTQAMILAAQGYRAGEIGDQMGRTAVATRTLLCRARGQLRTQMLAFDPA